MRDRDVDRPTVGGALRSAAEAVARTNLELAEIQSVYRDLFGDRGRLYTARGSAGGWVAVWRDDSREPEGES